MSQLLSLPVCRWREERGADRLTCHSPNFLLPPNQVSGDTCRNCACPDHARMVLPRAAPCVHLGAYTGKSVTPRATGIRRDLFECVLHGRCAADGVEQHLPRKAKSCTHCDDYVAGDPGAPNSAQMRATAEAFLARIPVYPRGRYLGRGIVIAGGGERFFASLYVTIRAVRHVGCKLPIQVWYLGRNNEMPPDKQALLKSFGATCIDADQVRLTHPARQLDGWELKVFAALHSSFEELLFLDADCYPVRNPEFLFRLPGYRQRGAIFWPDSSTPDPRLKWPAYGVPDPNRAGSVESGQFLINKKMCWCALNLAWFYNDHSDYYYRCGYGDKHTFEVAWTRVGLPFVMFTPRARVEEAGYVHIGPDHRPLFIHRCSDKFRLQTQSYETEQQSWWPRYFASLPLEKECWSWLGDLAALLGVRLWPPRGDVIRPVATRPERITLATLYTPEIAAYGELSARVLCKYAERHGYRTITRARTLNARRPPAWSKLPLIQRAFAADPRCQWLMWIDADALIVRHETPLTEFLDDEADFIIGDDAPHGPLNTGVFFARNCASVQELLRRAYAKTHLLHDRWWEQAALIETLREGVDGLRLKIVPRRLFNSFASEFQAGDFVIHYPNYPHAERVRQIQRRAGTILFPMPHYFRAGTNDRGLFDCVFGGNEYQLDDDLRGALVLDVGGHIGSFVYACALRGAREIWSIEAHPENHAILERNLEALELPGKHVPVFGAVWGNRPPPAPLRIHPGDGYNRGGRFLTAGDGAATKLIRFDDIVRRMTRNGRRRIDLVKLDCEAAEFPILYTSKMLGAIDKICAEIHPWMGHPPELQTPGYANDAEGLTNCLEKEGFRVRIDGCHLWAWRPNSNGTR